jgi:hypothetical protein
MIEALALWCGAKVPVVLYVDEQFSWEQSGLSDALAFGLDTLFFGVKVVPLETRRCQRPKRLLGSVKLSRRRQLLPLGDT